MGHAVFGFVRRLWRWTWRPRALALGTLIIGGIAVGIGTWAGGSAFLEHTSTNEYCTSCHELAPVIEEYEQSTHFMNASGVRAACADCHVPQAFWPSVVDHAHALVELYRHYDGTIETREAFEEHRLRLAQQVWDEMESSNSRECRTCHIAEAFDFEAQSRSARAEMEPLAGEHGGNCITCHRGIVHAMPDLEAAAAEEEAAQIAALTEGAGGDLADEMFVVETAPLTLTPRAAGPDDPRPDAQVLPGVALSVLGSEGDFVQVRISGWEQEGANQVMYALIGQRIVSLSMQPAAQELVSRGETRMVEATGQNWTETALEGWVPRTSLTSDQEALWAYAHAAYDGACSICHAPHHPDQFLANQWVGQMRAMRDRSPITGEQYRLILRYLQMNARDTAGDGGH